MDIKTFQVRFIREISKRDRRLSAMLMNGTVVSVQPELFITFPETYTAHRICVASKVSLVEEVAEEILGKPAKLLISKGD